MLHDPLARHPLTATADQINLIRQLFSNSQLKQVSSTHDGKGEPWVATVSRDTRDRAVYYEGASGTRMQVRHKNAVYVDVGQLQRTGLPSYTLKAADDVILDAQLDQAALIHEFVTRPVYTTLISACDGDGEPWEATVFRDAAGNVLYQSASGVRYSVTAKPRAGASAASGGAGSSSVSASVWPTPPLRAATLRACYLPVYSFPAWAVTAIDGPGVAGIHGATPTELKESVEVLYHTGDDLALVKALAREREPVNIGRGGAAPVHDQQQYLVGQFSTWTGVHRALYGAYYEANGVLPPNIAIYCRTLFSPVQSDALGAQSFVVHVINLIGYAFDVPQQPDYRALIGELLRKNAKSAVALIRKDLLRLYTRVWTLAYGAMQLHKLTRLVYAGVGASSFIVAIPQVFANEYDFMQSVQEPAMTAAAALFPTLQVTRQRMGMVPQFITEDRANAAHTLYVNAWDPFSMVGNGNGGDQSLDGYWGRHTCMAPQCSPLVNDSIRCVPIST